jgi:excisionase family DNA binding protein
MKLYSTLDAARKAGVSTETIRYWIKLGKLECYRTLGGRAIFTEEQIMKAIELHSIKKSDREIIREDFEVRDEFSNTKTTTI